MPNSELTLTFLPPLLEILLLKEKQKGSPLTQEEVLHIRDKAICMTVRKSILDKIEESRGYKDITPEDCWEEFCKFKTSRKL